MAWDIDLRSTREDERTPEAADRESQRPGLEIPPLPTRIDLDDEMREAFLADATDLFERIEKIVIGLGSLDDHARGDP